MTPVAPLILLTMLALLGTVNLVDLALPMWVRARDMSLWMISLCVVLLLVRWMAQG